MGTARVFSDFVPAYLMSPFLLGSTVALPLRSSVHLTARQILLMGPTCGLRDSLSAASNLLICGSVRYDSSVC